MASKVTIHFRDERVDRATYIAQTVGFGKICYTSEYWTREGLYTIIELTETGVMIVRGANGILITMYIASKKDVLNLFKQGRLGRVPTWLMAKVEKNKQKGYLENQPNRH